MSTFEADYIEVRNDPTMASVILQERQAEIKKLRSEQAKCTNGFRGQCLEKQIQELKWEYRKIEELIF